MKWSPRMFCLLLATSTQLLEDLLSERGIIVSYGTLRLSRGGGVNQCRRGKAHGSDDKPPIPQLASPPAREIH